MSTKVSHKQISSIHYDARRFGLDLKVQPCVYDAASGTFSGANTPTKAHLAAATKVVKEWTAKGWTPKVSPAASRDGVARWLALGDAIEGLIVQNGMDEPEAVAAMKAACSYGHRVRKDGYKVHGSVVAKSTKAKNLCAKLGLNGIATWVEPTAPTTPTPATVSPTAPLAPAAPAALDKGALVLNLIAQGKSTAEIADLLATLAAAGL